MPSITIRPKGTFLRKPDLARPDVAVFLVFAFFFAVWAIVTLVHNGASAWVVVALSLAVLYISTTWDRTAGATITIGDHQISYRKPLFGVVRVDAADVAAVVRAQVRIFPWTSSAYWVKRLALLDLQGRSVLSLDSDVWGLEALKKLEEAVGKSQTDEGPLGPREAQKRWPGILPIWQRHLFISSIAYISLAIAVGTLVKQVIG